MSKRSLQRRLTAAGTSFDAIVDSVRSDLAYAYLQDSRLSVAQIAETLHFSETSALSRAVRRWYTVSPRSEEHTSELQSLMRISYAVFCLKKKKTTHIKT